MEPPPDPAVMAAMLQEAVFFARVTRSSHVAAYSLFVYDWLMCLPEEIKLLMQPGASRGKITYFFCRLWPLLTYPITLWVQMSDHDPVLCAKIFRIPMFLTIPNLASAAAILILRIYAFTGGKRSVVIFLGVCLLAAATFQAYVSAAKAALIPIPIGCYPVDTGPEKYLSGYFLAALLFDCVVTAVFVGFSVTKLRLTYSEMSAFTKMFIREGAGYFLAISVVNIINGYFNYQPKVPMATVNVPMSLVLPNLLACRLVINLRSSSSDTGQTSFHPLSLRSSEGPTITVDDIPLSDKGRGRRGTHIQSTNWSGTQKSDLDKSSDELRRDNIYPEPAAFNYYTGRHEEA